MIFFGNAEVYGDYDGVMSEDVGVGSILLLTRYEQGTSA